MASWYKSVWYEYENCNRLHWQTLAGCVDRGSYLTTSQSLEFAVIFFNFRDFESRVKLRHVDLTPPYSIPQLFPDSSYPEIIVP